MRPRLLVTDPHDVANPDCTDEAVGEAARTDPARLGPRGDDLLRFGWASAALDAHPVLHGPWAGTEDRAVRRALMRSPELPDDVARAVVATRRTGMHTLGANPVAPAELLERNPGARRRRARIAAVLPGGLRSAAREPNRPELVALGSPTVDLVVAHAPTLAEPVTVALATRPDPVVDPWVLALLVDRFGATTWEAARPNLSRGRAAAAASLSQRAWSLVS